MNLKHILKEDETVNQVLKRLKETRSKVKQFSPCQSTDKLDRKISFLERFSGVSQENNNAPSQTKYINYKKTNKKPFSGGLMSPK